MNAFGRTILGLTAVIVAASGAVSLDTSPAPGAPGDFAFVNVTVIPMDRPGSLTNQTVLVSDGKIQAIGSSERLAVRAGYTVIDGRG